MDENMTGACEFTRKTAEAIIKEAGKVVVGQYDLIEKIIVTMLSGGHVLLEGVPGLAKTLAARAVAKTISSEFKRVQFTPDLMPSDITGTKVFDVKAGSFYFKKGPLFTNILLADEINRTPPKTQAALLESMEERSITIDGETYNLGEPFLVIATQNPVEYEGTYPLPEAQLDRFMLKLKLNYVPQKYENMILEKYNANLEGAKADIQSVKPVCSFEDLKKCREEIVNVRVEPAIVNYITSFTAATRNSPSLMLGASPRASIALMLTAKALAAVQGRNYVTPEDIKELALPVMRHRILLKPETSMDGIGSDEVIKSVLNRVEVPR